MSNFSVNKTSGSGAPSTIDDVSTQPVTLTQEQREKVRLTRGTCPFIGSAMTTLEADGLPFLPIRNSADNPIASIDDVIALGDSGGGDLGSVVLKVFAEGNHAFMLGPGGQLTRPVPAGTFGACFPGSDGAHYGQSGILMGDPRDVSSGGFHPDQLQRLLDKAKGGYISRSAFAEFIAENMARDPNATVFGGKAGEKIGGDFAQLVGAEGRAVRDEITSHRSPPGTPLTPREREVFEKLTQLTGADNLVGSAGEFGLLFAFLARSPNTRYGPDGEPALSVEDVTSMFQKGQLPAGWDKWAKTAQDWVGNTMALAVDAGKICLERDAAKKARGWIP
jgi:hypothetical protein